MRKANGAGKAVGKIVTYLLIVLLVLGVAGAVFYFVAKQEGVSFYVEYDGTRYYSGINEGNLWLPAGDTYSFSVKSLTGGDVDYSVSVESNGEHNFTFVADGEFQDFYIKDNEENNDYSQVFSLQKDSDAFSVSLPQGLTVEKAIEGKFGADIQLQKELSAVPYFMLVLRSGENVIRLFFAFEMQLVLDNSGIIF